ncbi:hypothetical protein [Tsukamurella paurometabola]
MSPLLVESEKTGRRLLRLVTEQLLPHGLLGLVIVGFSAHTMAMCSSDANAIAAVFRLTWRGIPAQQRGANGGA